MFDQPIIRVCLVLGSLITATYILRRVRLAKVQIEGGKEHPRGGWRAGCKGLLQYYAELPVA